MQQQQARPFRHAAHRALSCRECHTIGEGHRIARTWRAADCAACHHDPARAYPCASCHTTADLPPPVALPVALALSVWDTARIRNLPFDHATHAPRACQECHLPPAGVGGRTQCAACHAEHHRAEADCALCHRAAEPGVHGLPSHLTCTGSGCHARIEVARPPLAMATRPVLSRTLCLLCHDEQRDHEPGGACHVCHQIPESSR